MKDQRSGVIAVSRAPKVFLVSLATTLVFACYLYQFWQSGNLKVSYVLGKHPWTVSNNGYECHEGHSYTTQVLDDVWNNKNNKNQRKAIFS